MKKNVIFHIYPRMETNAWIRGCQHLLARRGLFDGKRIVAIVTDELTFSADEVKRRLPGFEFIVMKNDARLREVTTWSSMWDCIPHDDSATLCVHGKGVTRGHEIISWWVDLGWHLLCDYPELIDEALKMRPIVGCFKRQGFIPDYPWPCPWHFSGSFYWVRSADAPRRVDDHGWGTEAWPGRNFREEDACCLFMENTASFYDQAYWAHGISPAFRYWRAAAQFAGLCSTDCSTTDWSLLPPTTFPPLTGPGGFGTTVPVSGSRPRIRDFLTHACNCSPR